MQADIQQAADKRAVSLKWVSGAISLIVFFLIWMMLPPEVGDKPRIAMALTGAAIILWITDAVTLGQTSFLILIVIGFTNLVPLDIALSGFSSGAIFLIIAGMMLARAVNDTPLAKRVTYYIFYKSGGTPSRVLAAIILISQVQAFFIPATAVRATLLMPIVIDLLKFFDHRAYPNIRRQMMLGVAFGGNVSGVAILPAAVGNVLAVEILNIYLQENISYFAWLYYAFPIWLLMIPMVWIILLKTYPAEVQEIVGIKEEMQKKLNEIGPLTRSEKKCLITLGVTVLMWMTESIHHMHPAIPALFAALVLSLPRVGVSEWKNLTQINLDTVFVLGVTLSLGRVLNETGAIEFLGGLLNVGWLTQALQHPIIAVFLIVLITQLYHLCVSNVSTAVVTLLPVLIGLATQIGIDPIFITFTAALTCLFGFILVVETMPNVIVQGSGYISQREFIVPGIWATIASSGVTVAVAATWWKWIGLIS